MAIINIDTATGRKFIGSLESTGHMNLLNWLLPVLGSGLRFVFVGDYVRREEGRRIVTNADFYKSPDGHYGRSGIRPK